VSGNISQYLKNSNTLLSFVRWFDSEAGLEDLLASGKLGVDWFRIVPFILLHLMCLGVFWVGWSWFAAAVAVGLYLIRMFAITGFYHRYFSHRTYKTSRVWQFLFAILGNSSVQRGPLWWAGHHRHHHRFSDEQEDPHSPAQHGFWHSHIGWLTTRANFPTRMEYVSDWAKYPELLWINRFDVVIPMLLAISVFLLGEIMAIYAPGLRTNGPQLLIWGFFVSTVFLFHGTSTINSLDHMIGTRRYNTPDTSRNNAVLAIITLGEGWHNNHHHYPVATRQGFYWWEIDITYYLLVLLSWLGIIRDLRAVPEGVRSRNQVKIGAKHEANLP
jgi:stearoyl-CoA desaturase (delta-9 desaturase)